MMHKRENKEKIVASATTKDIQGKKRRIAKEMKKTNEQIDLPQGEDLSIICEILRAPY
jgi:hypothetical protein